MSFYQSKNKIMYRRYRMVRRIIWSFTYVDPSSFRGIIMLLINLIQDYTFMTYGMDRCLVELNDYYTKLCVDEMYKRIRLEFEQRGFNMRNSF